MDKWFEIKQLNNGVGIVLINGPLNVRDLDDNTMVQMSIDKFKAVLKAMKAREENGNKVYIHGIGAQSCPLCVKCIGDNFCTGCPIKAVTHQQFCNGTPYHDLVGSSLLVDMIESLKAEIKFLKGILK